MAGEETVHVNSLIDTILGATRGYFATEDAGLQDSYHKAAETAREELLDLGYGGLARDLGEERTLTEKESTAAGWRSYVRARTPGYEDFGALVAPSGVGTAGEVGVLASVGQGVSGLAGAVGQAAEAVGSAAPAILRWLPWILGGLFAARIFRVKMNLGRG